MSLSRIILLVIALPVLFTGELAFGQAHYPFTKTPKRKGYEFRFKGKYRKTDALYDKDGTEVALQEGESYSFTDVDAEAEYGYSRNLAFDVGVRFRSLESTQLGPNDTELYPLTESGVHSGMVGMRYAWDRVDNMFYTLELQYRQFSFSNATYDAANDPNRFVALGDDSRSFHGGISLTFQPKYKMNFLSARILYASPAANISDEVQYAIEGALVWRKFALVAGLEGVNSMNTDPYASDADRPNKPALATGPSNFFNSINRNYQEVYGGINLKFGQKWRVELRAGQTMSGNDTDKFQTFGVNLVMREDTPTGATYLESSSKFYSIEGEVIRVSPKGTYAVINVGLADGLRKGARIDLYSDNFLGGSKLVASGIVVKMGAGTSIIQIGRYYGVDKVTTGLSARGGE
jgi:hypothetical protein